MRVALIGLTGMAVGIACRLQQRGVEVIGCDENGDLANRLVDQCGAVATTSVVAALRKLPKDTPKIVWLMLPEDGAVDKEVKNLAGRLALGDIVVDGSFSNYRDSQRRGALLSQSGVGFVDVGISDGGNGREQGFCITVGGERDHVNSIEPLLQALAAAAGEGWAHVGAVGTGHFARMVQSGIELSLRQAYHEGLSLLAGKQNFSFDLSQVVETWRKAGALGADLLTDELAGRGAVNPGRHSPNYDEVRWSVIEAVDQNVSVPVISAALNNGKEV